MGGLSHLRQQLMDMKETVLETCVAELKSAVVGECAFAVGVDECMGCCLSVCCASNEKALGMLTLVYSAVPYLLSLSTMLNFVSAFPFFSVSAAGTEQLMKDYDSQSDSEDEETADNK